MATQDRATEQLGFRVTPAEKAAADELAALWREETGDGSLSGWFRALLRREARAHGVKIGGAPALPIERIVELDPPTPAPAPKQKPLAARPTRASKPRR